MTVKEFKVQRALGIAEDSYSIRPDGFFGKVEFDNTLITIPYWLACNIRDWRDKGLPSHDLLFDYIEAQLL